MAEKSNPRPPARGQGAGLHDLCGKISAFGAEAEKQELSIRTLDIFWWGDDYCTPADVELEDEEPPL